MQATEQSILASGGKAKAYHVDITDEARVMEAARAVAEDIGRVDVLVNNGDESNDFICKPTFESACHNNSNPKRQRSQSCEVCDGMMMVVVVFSSFSAGVVFGRRILDASSTHIRRASLSLRYETF